MATIKSIEENEKAYTELINRLEDVKDAIKKQNYGIAMDILCKPYPQFQVITHSELKESEDERIRKAIHIYLDWLDGRKDYTPKGEYSIRDMIAWLEAQGEHANFRNKIQIGDKVTRNEDGVLVNLSQLKRVAKKNENQGEQKVPDVAVVRKELNEHLKPLGEQKPAAKYKVGDTVYYDLFGRLVSFAIANIVEDGTGNPMYEDKDGNSIFQNEIVEQKPYGQREECSDCQFNYAGECKGYCAMKRGEQKPTWSKEDEYYRNIILYILNNECVGNADRRIAIDWLKSLKERVLPQPKQEWSKEDEVLLKFSLENLTELKNRFDEEYGKVGDCINWLKSLKERYTWKPSDEQMNALNYVVNLMASSERPTENDLYYNILKSLRQQLKKLMEDKLKDK